MSLTENFLLNFAETVRAMNCNQLANMLKQVITDKKYESDLNKLIGKFFC